MKLCPNNHENPDNAKFCRICGKKFAPFPYLERTKLLLRNLHGIYIHIVEMIKLKKDGKKEFTPDAFPHITFSPLSVVKCDFQVLNGWKSCLILCLIASTLLGITLNGLFFSKNILNCIAIIVFGIAIWVFIKVCRIIYRLIKKMHYKNSADYIESVAFVSNNFRIAKNCKLGLFDKSCNKVILKTSYNNISSFDSDHLIIEKKNKFGLYSLKTKRIIIPVKFDKISGFVNSIATCQKGLSIFHYDVNGNKLK